MASYLNPTGRDCVFITDGAYSGPECCGLYLSMRVAEDLQQHTWQHSAITRKKQVGIVLQALHKLVYVSGLVFGEQQAAFLLPWKRIFGYTDASLFVAKRDNAKALFKSFLDSQGGLQAQASLYLYIYIPYIYN